MHMLLPVTDNCPLESAEGETKVCIEPRTSSSRVRCPTDCATPPGENEETKNMPRLSYLPYYLLMVMLVSLTFASANL